MGAPIVLVEAFKQYKQICVGYCNTEQKMQTQKRRDVVYARNKRYRAIPQPIQIEDLITRYRQVCAIPFKSPCR